MHDFIKDKSIKSIFFDSRFSSQTIGIIWIESFAFALLIGLYQKSILWGVGLGLSLILLEGIPLMSVLYTMLFPLAEAILIFQIVVERSQTEVGFLTALAAFYILTTLHKRAGKIDHIAFGYAMILFDLILIAATRFLAIRMFHPRFLLLLFAVFFIAMLPRLRIVLSILLAATTAISVYLYIMSVLGMPYAFLSAAFFFLYSGSAYLWACLGNDLIELTKQKKLQRLLEEKKPEFPQIKSRMYEKYPVLAEQYRYYQISVCTNIEERNAFETDWQHYLLYLEASGKNITFNQFFDREKLYRIRRYKDNPYRAVSRQSSARQAAASFSNPVVSGYFAGVTDIASLKKRYRELLKIYHPDNQNGDTTVSRQIREEYDALSKKLKS